MLNKNTVEPTDAIENVGVRVPVVQIFSYKSVTGAMILNLFVITVISGV